LVVRHFHCHGGNNNKSNECHHERNHNEKVSNKCSVGCLWNFVCVFVYIHDDCLPYSA
jgi:hypothetical protein